MTYRLLIVDDEVHLVESLAETISWSKHGIDKVYQANSGAEAFEIMRTAGADIVVTDIRMPGMSGLELIRKIRRYWPQTKCVLLSGYSDFEYAKAAMQAQTVDYLLKPVGDDEITEVIDRIVADLQTDGEETASRKRAEKALREHLPLLRGSCLGELMLGRRTPAGELRDKLNQYELTIEANEPVTLTLIRLEEGFEQYEENDRLLMEFAVANMAQELLGDGRELWYTKDAQDYLVFLLPAGSTGPEDEGGFQSIDTRAAALQDNVRRYLKGGISVMLSRQGRFPDELPALYQSCLSAFRRRIGAGKNFLYAFGDAGEEFTQETPALSLKWLYEPPALLHLLEAGRWDAALEKLERLFDEMQAAGLDTEEYLLEGFTAIFHAYFYISHKNGRSLRDVLGKDYERTVQGTRLRSVAQLREWALRCSNRLQSDMERETEENRVSVVAKARVFIEGNLHRDVSLQAIADHVHLHPVYLSKIYKTETQEGLSDYLYRLRMEKAAFWLKQTNKKIYEITSDLGFQNPQYFSKLFRKHFGITPQEFRDGGTSHKEGAVIP